MRCHRPYILHWYPVADGRKYAVRLLNPPDEMFPMKVFK